MAVGTKAPALPKRSTTAANAVPLALLLFAEERRSIERLRARFSTVVLAPM
jgi:hypothetical protein